MSDTNNTTQTIVEQLKGFARAASAIGVVRFSATYDGGGDSGDVEIQVVQSEVALQNPSTPRDRWRRWDQWVADATKPSDTNPNPIITQPMCQAFEEAIYDLLPSGWEIDDGSFGEIVVDIAADRIRVEHNERCTTIDTSTYEF